MDNSTISTVTTTGISTTTPFDEAKCTPRDHILLSFLFLLKGLYGLITVFVYYLNVKAMGFSSCRMNKSFYKLYATVAFLSSFYFIEYYLVKQFPMLGWFCHAIWSTFAQPNWYITPTRVIAAYCPIALLVFHFLISLHRLLCLIQPIGVKKWDNHFWSIWTVGVVIPLIFMWFVAPCRGFVYLDAKNGGLGMEYEDFFIFPGFKLSSTMLSVIAAGIFGSLTLLNTVAILFLLKKRSKISEKDCGLIYFEILLAFVTLIFAGTQTVLYFAKNVIKDDFMKYLMEYVRAYVIDIFILPNAWTIIIFSKNVRRTIKEILVAMMKCQNVTSKMIRQRSSVRSSASRIVTVSTF